MTEAVTTSDCHVYKIHYEFFLPLKSLFHFCTEIVLGWRVKSYVMG